MCLHHPSCHLYTILRTLRHQANTPRPYHATYLRTIHPSKPPHEHVDIRPTHVPYHSATCPHKHRHLRDTKFLCRSLDYSPTYPHILNHRAKRACLYHSFCHSKYLQCIVLKDWKLTRGEVGRFLTKSLLIGWKFLIWVLFGQRLKALITGFESCLDIKCRQRFQLLLLYFDFLGVLP